MKTIQGFFARKIQVVPRIIDEKEGPAYSASNICQTMGDACADVELHVIICLPIQIET
ncbi:MAG: hypothetical protein JXA30_19800 [Deltaproteobacteria bacterium]|nr:hypothetical protein [Deltaproteobacteria bacterium]